MFHEALDIFQPRMGLVAKPARKLRLSVKTQTVFAAAGNEMQMAANRPEKVFAFLEPRQLLVGKRPLVGKLFRGIGVIEEFRDPEQRMKIAQAPLAILQIGFDQVTAFTTLGQANVAFGKFVGHKFPRPGLHNVAAEMKLHILAEPFISANEPCLENGSEDCIVGLGQPDAFFRAACRVADFQAYVPERIENELNQPSACFILFSRQQEQEVNVRAGSQGAAPITACGDDGHFLRFTGD